MILPVLIVVPALLVGAGLYVAISRLGLMPDMTGGGVRPTHRDRFAGDYDEDGLWPVRQVQRIPQGILVGLVVVMAVWVVAWLIFFFVALGMMSV